MAQIRFDQRAYLIALLRDIRDGEAEAEINYLKALLALEDPRT